MSMFSPYYLRRFQCSKIPLCLWKVLSVCELLRGKCVCLDCSVMESKAHCLAACLGACCAALQNRASAGASSPFPPRGSEYTLLQVLHDEDTESCHTLHSSVSVCCWPSAACGMDPITTSVSLPRVSAGTGTSSHRQAEGHCVSNTDILAKFKMNLDWSDSARTDLLFPDRHWAPIYFH